MALTDELREWAKNHRAELELGQLSERNLIDIANRIQKTATTQSLDAWFNGYSSAIDEFCDKSMHLPVDADGVSIHVGDVMDTEHFGTVEVEGFVHNAIVFYNYSGQPAYLCTSPANLCHHHHAPTVEDVLREFADRVCNSGHQWGLDAADTIAEYASRLRLAGDDE